VRKSARFLGRFWPPPAAPLALGAGELGEAGGALNEAEASCRTASAGKQRFSVISQQMVLPGDQ
jgi:hypothetical protein